MAIITHKEGSELCQLKRFMYLSQTTRPKLSLTCAIAGVTFNRVPLVKRLQHASTVIGLNLCSVGQLSSFTSPEVHQGQKSTQETKDTNHNAGPISLQSIEKLYLGWTSGWLLGIFWVPSLQMFRNLLDGMSATFESYLQFNIWRLLLSSPNLTPEKDFQKKPYAFSTHKTYKILRKG